MKKTGESIQLFGLGFFGNSRSQLLKKLQSYLVHSSKTAYIFTPNPEHIVQAYQEEEFFSMLQLADILLPDGIGLVWASRLLAWKHRSKPLAERLTGVDVMTLVWELVTARGESILVLGGKNYLPTQEGTIQIEANGKTLIGEWMAGYEHVAAPRPEEEAAVKRGIKELQPAVVFVALGAPHQEKWALEHRDLLESSGVKIVMVVGGALDYFLGEVQRAPKIWQQLGVEWLYRLVMQPWRWRRQLRLLTFIGLLLQELFSREKKEEKKKVT